MIYRKSENNKFIWFDSKEVDTIYFICSYDYSESSIKGTLYKHGTKEDIEKLWKQQKEVFDKLEEEYPFENTKHFILDVTDIAYNDLEEINKCLEVTGYIGKFLENNFLKPELSNSINII